MTDEYIKIMKLRDICIDYEFEVKEGFYLCPIDKLEEKYITAAARTGSRSFSGIN